MDIPVAVLQKAQGLIDLFEGDFFYLGIYEGCHAYKFVFPPDVCTGFPFVYLYDKTHEKVQEITGHEALDIISEFI